MDSVEEIVAVMRADGNDPEGMRLREARRLPAERR